MNLKVLNIKFKFADFCLRCTCCGSRGGRKLHVFRSCRASCAADCCAGLVESGRVTEKHAQLKLNHLIRLAIFLRVVVVTPAGGETRMSAGVFVRSGQLSQPPPIIELEMTLV